MWKNFLLKLKESFFSVFPITVVIYAVILCLGIADTKSMILLGISAVLLILGISLFHRFRKLYDRTWAKHWFNIVKVQKTLVDDCA